MAYTLVFGSLHAKIYEVSKSSNLPPKPLVRDNAKEVVLNLKTNPLQTLACKKILKFMLYI